MTQLEIYNVTGLTIPYQIYICDVYGNQCVLVASVNTNIPPSATITLPPQFNTAPAIGVKLNDTFCEKLVIINCNELLNHKQFQDGDEFFFMDYSVFQFQ
jgi:hypothetical protein